MQAYGFSAKMTESECVAALFRRYGEMANDIENIGNLIKVIRGRQVMLDKDLAALNGSL